MRFQIALVFALVVVSTATATNAQTRSVLSPAGRDSIIIKTYEENQHVLAAARTIQCRFDSGFATDILDNGSSKTQKMSPDGFGIITYDNIDSRAGTAREISDVGGKDLQVLSSKTSLTFVEITLSGNPVFTSVFATPISGKIGTFVAVTSRHISPLPVRPPDVGLPPSSVMSLAQYYGKCELPLAH